MTNEETKELLGHLDEVSNRLIELETFLVESGLKSNLSRIADSLEKLVDSRQ